MPSASVMRPPQKSESRKQKAESTSRETTPFAFCLLVSAFWFVPFIYVAFCSLPSAFCSSWTAGAAGNRFVGLFRGPVSDLDIAFFAAEVDAPETSERTNLEDVDVGRLLRLVRRNRRVTGGSDFQDVQRLSGDDHVTVPRPVDELRMVVGDVPDDL